MLKRCLLVALLWAQDASAFGGRCEWRQWGQSFAHDGQVCAAGQEPLRELAHVTIDPFVAQEQAEVGGSLVVHYQVPLLDRRGYVFVLQKAGTYVSCDPPGSGTPAPCGWNAWGTQVWTEAAFRWRQGRLVQQWSFASDWKPVPGRLVSAWEPMFQPALSAKFVYVPGAGGTIYKLDKRKGRVEARINPFGTTIDPNTYVAGGLTIDASGNVYYNVLRLDPSFPVVGDAEGWLVKVSRRDDVSMVAYRDLIPGAPAADDLCFLTFSALTPPPPSPLPPPPNPDGSPALPPRARCSSQRPALNVTPAVGPDGTIFTVSRAHRLGSYAYVVALTPDLQLKWATSLRDLLHDGCGVLVPYDTSGVGVGCRPGATLGVDPFTNLPPAGNANDLASSSPIALPDGGVVYGVFTNINGSRGHLMKLDASGGFVGAYDFGWDTTPAIHAHDGTYSIVIKDNHYATDGPFFITQLDADLNVEWQFAHTNTETCERLPDGTVSCFDDGEHPNGFEWCINAPAVDRDGTVYATSEDGNFYAIGQGGTETARVFLDRTLGAAYTPLAIDPEGRIYAMNNGELSVLGR
jgi:outer membrane protein assembly factor BamB